MPCIVIGRLFFDDYEQRKRIFKKGDIYINRWREDFLTKSYGNFVYISDLKRNKFWSNTYEPTNVIPEKYKVEFSNHKVDFYRLTGILKPKRK